MRLFQADSTSRGAVQAHVGVSLKKPHHIVTIQFSDVVKDHANSLGSDPIFAYCNPSQSHQKTTKKLHQIQDASPSDQNLY